MSEKEAFQEVFKSTTEDPIQVLDQILSGTYQNTWIYFTRKDFSFKLSKKNDKIVIDFLDKPIIVIKYLAHMQTEIISITIDKDYIYIKTGIVTIPVSRKDLDSWNSQNKK